MIAHVKQDFDPVEHGILMTRVDELPDMEQVERAINNIYNLNRQRPGVMKELTIYRKHTQVLIDMIYAQERLLKQYTELFERYERAAQARNYHRWSEDEDNMLVDMVCSEDCSLLALSTALGRTVPAIKTRLTYLVGRKRLSQKVAGRFIGTVNGENAEGFIKGTVYTAL